MYKYKIKVYDKNNQNTRTVYAKTKQDFRTYVLTQIDHSKESYVAKRVLDKVICL